MDPIESLVLILTALVVLVIAFKVFARKFVIHEGHVGLLYRNGAFRRELSVGGYWRLRFRVTVAEIDVRERSETIPGQEVLTKDNLGIKVSLVLRYTVADAPKAAHAVQSYQQALYVQAQLALRTAVAAVTAEEILNNRLDISTQLRGPVAEAAAAFGVTVQGLDIKDVMLPAEQRRAFTEVLKARMLGQAALERTRAETASLRSLANAAKLLDGNPSLMTLRTLETVESAGQAGGNTIVLGVHPGVFNVGGEANRSGNGNG